VSASLRLQRPQLSHRPLWALIGTLQGRDAVARFPNEYGVRLRFTATDRAKGELEWIGEAAVGVRRPIARGVNLKDYSTDNERVQQSRRLGRSTRACQWLRSD
jgi:hypothetical protein